MTAEQDQVGGAHRQSFSHGEGVEARGDHGVARSGVDLQIFKDGGTAEGVDHPALQGEDGAGAPVVGRAVRACEHDLAGVRRLNELLGGGAGEGERGHQDDPPARGRRPDRGGQSGERRGGGAPVRGVASVCGIEIDRRVGGLRRKRRDQDRAPKQGEKKGE